MSEVQAAVTLGQLERLEELVNQRLKVAALFKDSIAGSSLVKLQDEPEGYQNSYWAFSMILNTDNPQKDWYEFKRQFQKNGGDGYYAAWKLTYQEPLFQKEIQNFSGVWQKYDQGLCPNAEYLQARMIQLKTNYWKIEEAEKQAEILNNTLKEFGS
jgi:perosamine synthetase